MRRITAACALLALSASLARAAETDYDESEYLSLSPETGLSSYRFDSEGRMIPIGQKGVPKKFVPRRTKRPNKSNARPGKRRPGAAAAPAGATADAGAKPAAAPPSEKPAAPAAEPDAANSADGSAGGGVKIPRVGGGGAVPTAGSGPPPSPASGPANVGGRPGDSGGSLGDAQPAGVSP